MRSNRALTQWGAAQLVGGPRGWDGIWQVSGEGSRGYLDAFANVSVGEDFRTWHARVRPKLSITPPLVLARNNIARVVKLRLVDAGDPVVGTIRFRGVTKLTDMSGYATFVIPAGAARGAQRATGSSAGYVAGAATVRITR